MPFPNLRTFLYLAPSILFVLCFSTITVILERVTSDIIRSHTVRSSSGSSRYSGTNFTLNEDRGPMWAMFGVAALGVLVSCLSGSGMWEMRRVDGSRGVGQRFCCWGILALNVVTLGVGVGVLAWASVLQLTQSGGDFEVDRRYTRETWLCRIGEVSTHVGWANEACGTAKATRFMLIPIVVGALLALVAVFYAAKPRGGIRWLLSGHGRYGAFPSVYEMHAPPQFYPAPQGDPQQGFVEGSHAPVPATKKSVMAVAQPVYG